MAFADVFNSLFNRAAAEKAAAEERKKSAADRYDELVQRAAADKPADADTPDAIETLLAEAGKAIPDFKADVEAAREVFAMETEAANLGDMQARSDELDHRTVEAGRKLRQAADAFLSELADIRGLRAGVAADDKRLAELLAAIADRSGGPQASGLAAQIEAHGAAAGQRGRRQRLGAGLLAEFVPELAMMLHRPVVDAADDAPELRRKMDAHEERFAAFLKSGGEN